MQSSKFSDNVEATVYPDGSAFLVVGVGAERGYMAIHREPYVRELHRQLTLALAQYDAR